MADDTSDSGGDGLSDTLGRLDLRTQDLTRTAHGFARAMTSAFAQSVTGARGFDDILKSLALRMSALALQLSLKPITNALAGGFDSILAGLFGANAMSVKPFAAGGVIGTPSYFPLGGGSVGLAGEAGPEAIMPLTRGSDGRLGIAANGTGAGSITVNITTPDAESFRRSEVYVTGQIARAVARGQRGM